MNIMKVGDDHAWKLSGNLGYSGWNPDASNVILIILMINSVVILINILGIGVIHEHHYLGTPTSLPTSISLHDRGF